MKETNLMNLGQETLYTIETPGGLIGWDMQDHTNVDRMKKMYSIFEVEDKRYKQEAHLIEKKNDLKKDKFGMTKLETDNLSNYAKYINACEKALDAFFGDGTSKKIFFEPILNRVAITMAKVELLILDILPEHFEKSGVKSDQFMKDRLAKRSRFVNKDSDVIDLDTEATE